MSFNQELLSFKFATSLRNAEKEPFDRQKKSMPRDESWLPNSQRFRSVETFVKYEQTDGQRKEVKCNKITSCMIRDNRSPIASINIY